MSKGEMCWDPETKGRIVFDGDIPIVVGGETERMGTLMISIQDDENIGLCSFQWPLFSKL